MILYIINLRFPLEKTPAVCYYKTVNVYGKVFLEMIKILYEDKFIIAAEKPCGILSEASENDSESILSLVAAEKSIPAPMPVNRLDRNASGLILLAKNKSSAGKFSALVAERSVNKEYLAIVHGKPETASGIYKDLLFKDSSSGKSYVTDRERKGVKEALLEYRVLETKESEDGTLSLVRIKLHTGRTHQIRVQFSSRKTPLFGDGKYGSHTNRGEIALFSARMSFVHPFTKKQTDIKSLPDTENYPWNIFDAELNMEIFDTDILI